MAEAELKSGEFLAAQEYGDRLLAGPRAIAARYDLAADQVVVHLTTGGDIRFAPAEAEGLAGAATEDLVVIEVDELGLDIRFPRLDADLFVPALVEGVLGSRRWMARNETSPRQDGPTVTPR